MPNIPHSFKYLFWHSIASIIISVFFPIIDFCSMREHRALLEDWDRWERQHPDHPDLP